MRARGVEHSERDGSVGGIVDGQAPADPVLTVITTCYNTRYLVRDCLNSICEHPPAEPFEIILVDDASTDGARWCPQSSPKSISCATTPIGTTPYSNNRHSTTPADSSCCCWILTRSFVRLRLTVWFHSCATTRRLARVQVAQ